MTNDYTTPSTTSEWLNVRTNNAVAKAFQQMRAHVGQVLDGERLVMFVFGGAGLGKNHIVFDELRKRKLEKVQPITPASVKDLQSEFHNATFDRVKSAKRKTALPLVLDEARLVFETSANLNILKLALDGGKDAARYSSGYIWFEDVVVIKEDGSEKIEKVRHQGTSLAAPIIAMTNKNLHEFDRKMQDHAEALLSRVPPIMIPHDPIAVWEYVIYLALTTDVITHYRGKSLSLATRAAVIDWFTSNLHNLASVSVRTLESVRDAFASSSGALLDADLNLLLKPTKKRTDRRGPRPQDWMALRMEIA